MPTKSRGKSQANKDRRGLKKLRDLGIIRRADLRRGPTPAQKRTLKKYADVVSGRAAVVKPKSVSAYKKNKTYRIVGKSVIVPRRKGERISVDKKTGKIVHKRTIGKIKTSGSMERAATVKRPKAGARQVYALPVGSGDGVKWFRFRTYQQLQEFLSHFSKPYKNPDQYILVETLPPGERITPGKHVAAKRNEKLDDRLEAKLRSRRVARERADVFSIIGEDLI